MKSQPAPPIFTPEVAARAVMQAIRTDARELLVDGSVLRLVFGDMVLPGFIDRYLAGKGVKMHKSECDNELGNRSDNLFSPVDHPATPAGAFCD